ncbi:MAG: hypothetical protein ACFFE4_22940 [Candidatus Thorarchaeota archaeon]
MNQQKKVTLTKIKLLSNINKIFNGILSIFGAIIFIAILVLIMIQTFPLPILVIQDASFDRYLAIRRLYNFMYAFLTSMIVTGIIGIIFLIPITILISKKLKNLQSIFINQNQNKHYILFRKTSKRSIKPPKFF